jgi:NADH-quinone oxidoreductase subunit L
MYFLVFHGKERYDQNPDSHHDHGEHSHSPHESPWVVTLPLVLLAIPSVFIGYFTIEPMLYGDFLKDAIFVNADLHPAMHELKQEFHGAWAMAVHALSTLPLLLAVGGVALSYYMYMVNPGLPAAMLRMFAPLHTLLVNKYYLDDFNEKVLAKGSRALATVLWRGGDQGLIDGVLVNGSWKLVGVVSRLSKQLQTGFLYHYALVMILGMFGLVTWFVWLKP